MEYEDSITLEGQIVAIADEIAQRSHDIDDAFASNLLSFDEFLSYLKLRKFEKLAKEINKIENRKDAYASTVVDGNGLFASQISSAIVKYFISDVIDTSRSMIENYEVLHGKEFNNSHIIKSKLINFSENGETICNYLKKMLNNIVLNSTEVSISDQNASVIIKSLFETYYGNPRLLHNGTKRRIYNDFINDKNITDIIDLVEGSPKAVEEEFNSIKGKSTKEYRLKNKILVRDICDYISGMTDNYAVTEYNKICKSIL